MKTLVVTLLAIFTFTFSGYSQYSCSKFYPFSEGAKSQLTLYNAKGKTTGMVEYHIIGVNDTGGSETATIKTWIFDKKGTEISETEYLATCSDGVVSIDFKSLMRPEMLKAYGDIEYEIEGTNLDLPNNLSVGMDLPDAEIIIKLSMQGMNINMTTRITDRKVVGQETITTPAGTFECYVLTQTTEIKTMGSFRSTSKSWIAEGVGVVKTEDYNKRGKLKGSTLLTSFSD